MTTHAGGLWPWSLANRAVMTASVAQGLSTGMIVGAMLGAARATEGASGSDDKLTKVTSEALREATRLGVASAAGALVASLIPGGALVRGLVWIATGAAVLSAGQNQTSSS